MINTAKHLKVLAMAGTKCGGTMDVYLTQALELEKAGMITRKETFSVGGNRCSRWFLTKQEAA